MARKRPSADDEYIYCDVQWSSYLFDAQKAVERLEKNIERPEPAMLEDIVRTMHMANYFVHKLLDRYNVATYENGVREIRILLIQLVNLRPNIAIKELQSTLVRRFGK